MARAHRLSHGATGATARAVPAAARRQTLAGLTVLVAGLHLAALAWLTGGAARGGAPGPQATPPTRAAIRAVPVHMRLVAADAPALEAAQPATPPSATEAGATRTAAPEAAPAAEAAASTPMPRPAVPPARATATSVDPSTTGEEYLPRSALTLAPQAAAAVMLEYPPQAPAGRYRGVLTLFIDEQGVVRRVRVDSGTDELPELFQEAARQAFLAARFTPGEVQGRAVRSRLRIAVDFEAQDSPGTAHDRAAP